MNAILRTIPEFADFEQIHKNMLEWMECAPSSNEHAAWAAYSSGDMQKIRMRIADEYRIFDTNYREWEEQEKENELYEQEQEEDDRVELEIEMKKEDAYYDQLLQQLASPNAFEDADFEEDDANDEISDAENPSERSFMTGFEYEPNDNNDLDFSPLTDESEMPDEVEPEPPTFSSDDWRRGRDLLWKMRATHPTSRELLLVEADWLRLALVNQSDLHVFHSKAAFGKAILREIEIQSYVDAV